MNSEEMLQKVNEGLEKLAAELGTTSFNIRRIIFDDAQESYDKEDIETWLDDNGYLYTDNDVNTIFARYRSHYDSEYGVWENISASYRACGLKLEKE